MLYEVITKESAGNDPFSFFDQWMQEALEENPDHATSVALSTHGVNGFPESRIVLLKNFSADGFVFFTNYNSQKGRAIEKDPRVALHFYWAELERQVRNNFV